MEHERKGLPNSVSKEDIKRRVEAKTKYREIALKVEIANLMLDACYKHLISKYHFLSEEKALELAISHSANIMTISGLNSDDIEDEDK